MNEASACSCIKMSDLWILLLCLSVGFRPSSSNSSCKRSAGTILQLAFVRHAHRASLQTYEKATNKFSKATMEYLNWF